MPSLVDRIQRLLSPEAAQRGAEDDVIARAPEGVRRRLAEEIQRRRQAAAQADMAREGSAGRGNLG